MSLYFEEWSVSYATIEIMKPDQFALELETIETLIREGSTSTAKEKIQRLVKSSIPPASRCKLAQLARRVIGPELSLTILNPIVRPPGRKVSQATPQEKADYSVSLTKIGAVEEALTILESLDPASQPEVLLYRAFAHFSQWEYAPAIPLLDRYVTTSNLSEYQRLVGSTNLAAALVHEQNERADALLANLRKETEGNNHRLLFGHVLRLQAEWEFSRSHWDAMESYLNEAETILDDKDSTGNLFIRKWRAIRLLCQKQNSTALAALDDVRKSAVSLNHWETVRACDYHEAVRTHNQELALRVYFGSPYTSFRQELLRDFGRKLVIPESFNWSFSGKTQSNPRISHLLLPTIGDAGLKIRQGTHRCLSALAFDLYLPARIPTLHARIFPGDFYNPHSSPVKMHKLISRAREWIKSTKAPLVIEESGGRYRLSTTHGYALRIPRIDLKQLDKGHTNLLALLRNTMGDNAPFSAREAAIALNMNRWTMIALLKDAYRSGQLAREGKAANTRYIFITAAKLAG